MHATLSAASAIERDAGVHGLPAQRCHIRRRGNRSRMESAATPPAVSAHEPADSRGVLRNPSYHVIDGTGERATQTDLPLFVPIACFLQFVFGLRPEDNTACHGSPEQPSTDIGPWHGRIWVRHVLSPTPIELGAELVRDFQGVISFTIGEALPQRDRELRAILRGQFQEIRQGVGCHARSSHVAQRSRQASLRPADSRLPPFRSAVSNGLPLSRERGSPSPRISRRANAARRLQRLVRLRGRV